MSRHTDFAAPEGVRVRGAVVVVPGRGETQATYARLGRRLAADAYQVRVIDPASLDDAVADAADLPRPLVLLGADSGAAAIAALLEAHDSTAPWWPEAVVLAGLPGRAAGLEGGWDTELDARTSCPVHRETLTSDPAVERGALGTALPDDLVAPAYHPTTDIPRLVLVGDADPLADRAALATAVKALPRARLSVVHGAHHDVLNDRQHRSVAAEIVAFLETVGNDLVPVITVAAGTW
ncbi:alpha/beta hydrolase [Actinokineospora auranticolor]|uniref:Alpha-beta hydrolase superfamily lysophospholipase n=1 Tax=Actinokineospora auranticolor TaxID=155976 RepID=A0A2S6GN65_9PSEU|nr:alpha/beta hydrolase [Actinokineospora auranticolor]PPK66657.1 alpha-beta hydrolase superfamily lysophospholipase [Actinokineospora auranticolor]